MEFHQKRRQQFLGERYYGQVMDDIAAAIEMFTRKPAGSGSSELEGWMISSERIAVNLFERLSLRYTAGEPIESMRKDLEEIVSAYERYGDLLWKYQDDRNEPVFTFSGLDDYCQLMQLIGLSFLLHRKDLLPRIAALQDGVSAIGQRGDGNGGTDWLYEEFMSAGLGAETRFESEQLCCGKPYEALADAMSSENNDAALKDLHRFLKRWYKDLAGTGWHDSHKPDEAGNQGGYYGYWSFEAGAAVLLLGIEDDSSLHQYLYYPKDLVAWAREHANLSEPSGGSSGQGDVARMRCEAGQPCPREGWWFTPAKQGSRRHFQQGEVMPAFNTDYGSTIWQWDERQSQ